MSAKVAKRDSASPEKGYRDTERAHSETLRNLDEIMQSPMRLFPLNKSQQPMKISGRDM
jgi:hypothetical protein